MSAKMMTFVTVPPAMPDKRAAAERRADFAEIYDRFSPERAGEQASRCSQCGVPFCQVHCPLHNNIPDWLRLAAEGRLEEAYELSSATNNLPEICGRICPQDRLCEGNCVIEQSGHGGVTIGSVEKYITDTAFDSGWVKPVRPLRERAARSASSAPARPGSPLPRSCARQGYQVHVYDRYDRIGGLMIYGIPDFKLEKEIVAARAPSARWWHPVPPRSARSAATGPSLPSCAAATTPCWSPPASTRRATWPLRAAASPSIVPALDYLTASNRKGWATMSPASMPARSTPPASTWS